MEISTGTEINLLRRIYLERRVGTKTENGAAVTARRLRHAQDIRNGGKMESRLKLAGHFSFINCTV
jgi:hypothetical protein